MVPSVAASDAQQGVKPSGMLLDRVWRITTTSEALSDTTAQIHLHGPQVKNQAPVSELYNLQTLVISNWSVTCKLTILTPVK